MISIKQVLFLALISTFVLGCGGGSGGSKSSKAHKSLKGDWQTQCTNIAGTSNYGILLVGFDTEDGDYLYGEKLFMYNTSDCSGNTLLTFSVLGNVEYDGTHSTSICEAERYDVDFSILTVNGEFLTGNDFDQGMKELGLSKSHSSIACKHRGNLYLGLVTPTKDATSPSTRPVVMNQEIVLFPSQLGKSAPTYAKKGLNKDINLNEIKEIIHQIKNYQ